VLVPNANPKKGNNRMAVMMVQQKVKSSPEWKKVYDSIAGLRVANGQLSDQVFQDASDLTKVTVIIKWNSMENAQKWAQSPEMKAAMEKAGVLGPPSISFLNEV
jgi:heme-degrading monooxygenase HmoA